MPRTYIWQRPLYFCFFSYLDSLSWRKSTGEILPVPVCSYDELSLIGNDFSVSFSHGRPVGKTNHKSGLSLRSFWNLSHLTDVDLKGADTFQDVITNGNRVPARVTVSRANQEKSVTRPLLNELGRMN